MASRRSRTTLRRVVSGVALCSVLAAALVLVGPRLYAAWYREQARDPAFFADEIAAFAVADAAAPPPSAPIVFVGSSSIRLWSTLAEAMAPLPVLNRGFGGSQLAHVLHYADAAILRYAPRAVVLYGGDNDLDASTGKRAEDVAEDFAALVARIHADTPEARIYFLAIKPSRLRWERWPEMQRANALVAAHCARDARLAFVDVATPLLGPDGRPRRELYRLDGLHLSAAGYAEWTRVVRARLCAELGGC
jgi:lysophospholipase L1-like esterase